MAVDTFSTVMNGQFTSTISTHYQTVLSRLGAQAASDREAASFFAAMNRQITYSPAEDTVLPCELEDPLGAQLYHKTPRLIHQYKNRCLLLTTSTCFAYCRFCFRRNYAGSGEGFITPEELEPVCAYLRDHAEIKEILLSGGDPLTAPNDKLRWLFDEIRSARPGILFRICTRSIVFSPERITEETVHFFRQYVPLWVIPHINHPAEISPRWSPESRSALELLRDSGVPVQSQSVLLRGINDSVPILAELFQDLTNLGVKPGYLFQGDLARGTSHFRVPLEQGVKLYRELKGELSGLSLPVYAVDLPGGGGKVHIMQTPFRKSGDDWVYKDPDGKEWRYPQR